MTDAPHPDAERDELVSAYLDGEATAAERARVEADPSLQAEVAELARVRAVLQDAPAPSPDERGAALAAALTAAAEPGGVLDPARSSAAPGVGADAAPSAVVPLAARAGARTRRARYLAVAAAVALAALAVPLLANLGEDDDDTESVALDTAREDAEMGAAAGDAFDDQAQEGGSDPTTTFGDPAAGATSLAEGDLGAHPDLDALADAVAARVREAAAEAPPVGSGEGLTTTTLGGGPCADQVEVPAGAELLLEALGTVDGVPVVVVVHQLPGGEPQLQVLAAEGCEVLTARPL